MTRRGYGTGSGASVPTGGATAANQTTEIAALAHLTDGTEQVQGTTAAGSADGSTNPVKGGAKYNSTKPTYTDGQRTDFQSGTRGALIVQLAAADSTSGLGTSATLGDGGSNTQSYIATENFNYQFNGATWDRLRTPKVFTSLNAVSVASEVTIWTPTAGKKFRLMGFCITQGTLAGNITLKDNTAGTTILIIPAAVVQTPLVVSLGNGILSAAANNVLTATGSATETISGFVYGTEE